MDWATEGSGFDIRQTYRFFFYNIRTGSGTKLIFQSSEHWGLSPPGGKLRTFPTLRMYRAVLTFAHADVLMVWGLIKIGTTFSFNQGRPETRGHPGQVNNLAPRDGE
jgi:hypothetical protein